MSSSKPSEGEPLPVATHVLRLPRPPKDFNADKWAPDWEVLKPSTGDEKDAEQRGKPVRVSVWDGHRTTINQARAFRAGATIVLRLEVREVLEVAEATRHELCVVYDPLKPPDDDHPGADGHAGIEGLRRAQMEPRPEWKARLQRLADRAKLVDGPA
jgi:hypothetical protein